MPTLDPREIAEELKSRERTIDSMVSQGQLKEAAKLRKLHKKLISFYDYIGLTSEIRKVQIENLENLTEGSSTPASRLLRRKLAEEKEEIEQADQAKHNIKVFSERLPLFIGVIMTVILVPVALLADPKCLVFLAIIWPFCLIMYWLGKS